MKKPINIKCLVSFILVLVLSFSYAQIEDGPFPDCPVLMNLTKTLEFKNFETRLDYLTNDKDYQNFRQQIIHESTKAKMAAQIATATEYFLTRLASTDKQSAYIMTSKLTTCLVNKGLIKDFEKQGLDQLFKALLQRKPKVAKRVLAKIREKQESKFLKQLITIIDKNNQTTNTNTDTNASTSGDIGEGIGALGGAIIGGLIGSSVGPEGTVSGAGVGAFVGSKIGKGVGEMFNDYSSSSGGSEKSDNGENTSKDDSKNGDTSKDNSEDNDSKSDDSGNSDTGN